MISKPILDVSAEEKEKATFECEVSKTNADVKWFKVRKSTGAVGKNLFRYLFGFFAQFHVSFLKT